MELKLPKIEERILGFWKEKEIFKKSLERTKNGDKFVFYEGPPFANGLPGIHHLLARAFKDIILRYKTMQGFYVERRAGWDTHGLPTEMSAEKSLGIKGKKEIEEDIERFIKECEKNVFTYKKDWENFTERIGYWLDLENAYITCGNDYIESLWWILKQVWDKGLLHSDYKVVPYCPRCGTSLSSHELAQGYKTIKENSIYVKFPLKEEKNVFLLVWTTTPWTLPGNVAVAVNPELKYVKAELGGETYILAKERLGVLKEGYKITEEMEGRDLIGTEYKPLFKFEDVDKKAWYVVGADYVSLNEGTGLVHIAPAFGEEDMEVGKANDLPVVVNVDEEGRFKKEVSPWKGMLVKEADPLIIEELKKKKALFGEEAHEHEYPFCWRCGSPLIYYAKDSWFIKVTEIKKDLIENNKKINWFPSYLKEGRFGEWLKEVKDWNLSRERYWGTPLPIWVCEKCGKRSCIGSIKELEDKAQIKTIENLHRPYIDKIVFDCDCGGKMKRVKEVIDCWFDSGSMPFAQWHYPFENKDCIDKKKFFPADYICEGIDQTRGWFYTLLVISTLLGLGKSYSNVVSVGIVLDEKGQKMSKSKGNVVKPADVIDKYGADTARFYFYTVNAVADPKNFSFEDVQTLYRKLFDTLFNVQNFFETYSEYGEKKDSEQDKGSCADEIKEGLKDESDFKSNNLLDKWIVSSLEKLNREVVKDLEAYDVVSASRLFLDFVDDLSNWYVRRSRKRFQRPENKSEKREAAETLRYVLLKLSQLLAPFAPFASEFFYLGLKGEKESVHLSDYPSFHKELINEELETEMKTIREIVALGLKERAKLGIKVRQPLSLLEVPKLKVDKELLELAKEELNVKDIVLGDEFKLESAITPELKEEGQKREIAHIIQTMRKKGGLKPEDDIKVIYSGLPEITRILEDNKEYFMTETKIKELISGDKGKGEFDLEEETKIEGNILWLAIKRIF